MINIRRTLAAVALGAGLTAASVACGATHDASSHQGTAVAHDDQPSLTAWYSANEGHMQQALADLQVHNLDAATDEWEAIPVPPVDPADWQQSVTDLEQARQAFDQGDMIRANNYASAYSTDSGAWLASAKQVMGQ